MFYNIDLKPDLISIQKEPLEGELIRLGETSVSLAYLRVLDLARSRYVKICRENQNLSK